MARMKSASVQRPIPASDAGDVRAVERSEGRLEGATAGERYGILLVFGVAADAAAGLCEIFAPLGIALSEGATEEAPSTRPSNSRIGE